jgi:hypothetical protein
LCSIIRFFSVTFNECGGIGLSLSLLKSQESSITFCLLFYYLSEFDLFIVDLTTGCRTIADTVVPVLVVDGLILPATNALTPLVVLDVGICFLGTG